MHSDTRLEAQVGAALLARGWTVCTAESCTGGLVAHRLTNIAGSSAYLIGGIVAYSYEAKESLLGVPAKTLAQYGAVSAETAEAMVLGALRAFGASIAVSITGIAGPGGGTAQKQVGLTYFGVATQAGALRVDQQTWNGDREGNKAQSADHALRLVLAMIETG